ITPDEFANLLEAIWRLVVRETRHTTAQLAPIDREQHHQGVRAFMHALGSQANAGQLEMREALSLPMTIRRHDLVEALVQRKRFAHLARSCGLMPHAPYRPIALVRGDWPSALSSQPNIVRHDDLGVLLVPHSHSLKDLQEILVAGVFISGPARPLANLGGSIAMVRNARDAVRDLPRSRNGLITCGDVLPELLEHQLTELAQLTAEKHLAKLAALSPRRRVTYAETMLQWLEHHGSLEALAKSVGLAAQTMRDRVAKCQELLGDSADDPVIRLALIVALRVRLSGWKQEGQRGRRSTATS
ncbi:MAG: PucR family transcriptional regulator, partial [Verrucomicrobiaceae bacterium]